MSIATIATEPILSPYLSTTSDRTGAISEHCRCVRLTVRSPVPYASFLSTAFVLFSLLHHIYPRCVLYVGNVVASLWGCLPDCLRRIVIRLAER